MALASQTRHHFSTDDYEAMVERGVLGPDDRVELIDGEVLEMTSIGPRHQVCVNKLNKFLTARVRTEAEVQVQGAIRIPPASEPQPDIALLRPPLDRYAIRHPQPADVFLVIEVSDSSLAMDRDVKAPMYGAACIPETWVIDLDAQRVLVMTEPGPRGYRLTATLTTGDTMTPGSLPGLAVEVSEIV